MTVKNIILGDNKGNELYPKTTANNIIDPENLKTSAKNITNPEILTANLPKANEVLSLNAGTINTGGNLNTITSNGFFTIKGLNSATLLNIPKDVKDLNLWAVVLNINVGGVIYQRYLQGQRTYTRAYFGDPAKWTEWVKFNTTTVNPA